MKVYRYMPSFFSGYDSEIKEIKTINGLLKIKFVKSWRKNIGKKFVKYGLVDRDENSKYLFVILKDNKTNEYEWWCTCWIENITEDILNYFPKLHDTEEYIMNLN